ncbi:MAG: hypothetical protein WA517_19625 [Candidatus Acidiferrum sp.]
MLTRHRRLLPRPIVPILRCTLAITTSVLLVVPADVSAAALNDEQPTSCGIAQPQRLMDNGLRHGLSLAQPEAQPTPEQIANRLDKLFSIVAEADRQIPRDTFDPQAIINKVGKDPTKIFEWVRDHTYFVPYRGLLRGDKGVLMDRLGNSLDRAMLLYSLLKFADQPARMAHGTLTETQAQDVLKKIRPFPSLEQRIGSSWSPATSITLAKQYAQENQLDLAEIRKQVEKLAAQEKATELKVKNRVVIQTAAIAAAVGHPPASVAAQEREDQVRAITDHWWVQWQNGARWTNLDPTLPGSLPGQTLTAAQSTVAPKNYTDVGENLLHTVEINVVIEVWKQGQVKEATALKEKLVPAAVIGEPIVLRQIPVHWPQDLNLFQEKDPAAAFKKAALAQTEWLPFLTVGSRNVSKYSFNDHGDLGNPSSPLAHAEEQGIGGLGGAIGGMLSSHQIAPAPKPAAKTQPGQVTAEWIDYVIQTPGNPTQTIRREIFDLIGPAARVAGGDIPGPHMNDAQKLDRTLSLMDTVDILPIAAQPSPEFILHSSDEGMLVNRGSALNLIRESSSAGSKEFAGELGKLSPALPAQLYSLAFARFKWSRNQRGIYQDEINILTYHKRPHLSSRGALFLDEGFDITANRVGVLADSTKGKFMARLEQGVLDTNVEAALAKPEREIDNTANAFFDAGTQGAKWLVIKDNTASAWRATGLPQDARARAADEVRKGYTVMAPTNPAQLRKCAAGCWWRINPRTGETLGIGDRGWGQTATEQLVLFTIMFLPQVVLTYVTYVTCRGTSAKFRSAKDVECLACGFVAGVLFSLWWIPFALTVLAAGGAVMADAAAMDASAEAVEKAAEAAKTAAGDLSSGGTFGAGVICAWIALRD